MSDFRFAVPLPRCSRHQTGTLVRSNAILLPIQEEEKCPNAPSLNRYPLKHVSNQEVLEKKMPLLIPPQYQSIMRSRMDLRRDMLLSKIGIYHHKQVNMLTVNEDTFFLEFKYLTADSRFRVYQVAGNRKLQWEPEYPCNPHYPEPEQPTGGIPLICLVSVEGRKAAYVGSQASYVPFPSTPRMYSNTTIQVSSNDHAIHFHYNMIDSTLKPLKVFVSVRSLEQSSRM